MPCPAHSFSRRLKKYRFFVRPSSLFQRRWQGGGMKKRQGAYREFTNIRILPSGYQVAITRNKKEYSKHFAGHSKDALKAAHHWRDRVLRLLPNKRSQPIPTRILNNVVLTQPVVGFSLRDTPILLVLTTARKDRHASGRFHGGTLRKN